MKTPKVTIFGGGTFVYTSCHFATSAPAFGGTARQLHGYARQQGFSSKLILTKMADYRSKIVTNSDLLEALVETLDNKNIKAVIFNAAVCDFTALPEGRGIGKSEPRLKTSEGNIGATLLPTYKVVKSVKKLRPDIILATFKTTFGADEMEMVEAGRAQQKSSNSDFVLVNDLKTRKNFIVFPKGLGGPVAERDEVLKALVRNLYDKASIA